MRIHNAYNAYTYINYILASVLNIESRLTHYEFLISRYRFLPEIVHYLLLTLIIVYRVLYICIDEISDFPVCNVFIRYYTMFATLKQ